MYYYGARYYDPRISIFISVDQKSEDFPNFMPYHYVHNRPTMMVDPTGMEGEDWYTNLDNGNIEWFEGSEQRDGYTNIGSSASAVIGDEHYDLKSDGKFKNLDTGKEYFKGDSVKAKSGTEIKSNGNLFNKAQSYFRENKQSLLKDAQTLQNTGDDVMIFGGVLAITGLFTEGVGTAAGGLVYSFGNTISNIGYGLTITTEIMAGDYSTKKGSWDAGWTIGGEVVNYGINRMVPKKASPKANEAVKIGFGNYYGRTKNYLEKKYEIR